VTETLTLRKITPPDESFLRVVYASTRTEELAQVDWNETQKDAFLQMQFDAQHAHYQTHYPTAEFLIIERAGEAIGRLYLARLPDEFRLIDIALLPQHRGQGIGSHLLRRILKEAEAAGKPVRIHVERTNPALHFYQRLGFQVIESGPIYLRMEKLPLLSTR
jgi:ribosomal protein S18 acetylase RimI-like enzyme